MRLTLPRHALALSLASLIALGGCGGGEDPNPAAPEADTSGTTEPAAVAPAAAEDEGTASADAPLSADDIAAFARGLAAENAALGEIAGKMDAATGDAERLAILATAQPATLEADAADAAGLAVERYRHAKDVVFQALGAIEMRAMMLAQQAALDTTGMDEETAARTKQAAEDMLASVPDPYASLDPATAEALKAREDELKKARAENIGLMFRAAGG